MYLLIGIWGSPGRVAAAGPFKWALNMLDVGGKEYAAMKLTLMLLAGSALILAAILGMYWATGGTSRKVTAQYIVAKTTVAAGGPSQGTERRTRRYASPSSGRDSQRTRPPT